MLSYQHAYHAGNLADIHKHSHLCSVLEILIRKDRPLSYMETHAGRGIYDLQSPEAVKTGEAAEGWINRSQDQKFLEMLPTKYVDAVNVLNRNGQGHLYPGSPYLAAHILRPQDRLHFMELHPQEHAALAGNFKNDDRVHIHKRDGLEGVLALAPPRPPEPRRGLVLIDPSYEMKEEYETVPAFAAKLHKKWPEACILIWVPMLPAMRHDTFLKIIKKDCPDAFVSEERWAKPEERRGLYGSLMVGLNMPLDL